MKNFWRFLIPVRSGIIFYLVGSLLVSGCGTVVFNNEHHRADGAVRFGPEVRATKSPSPPAPPPFEKEVFISPVEEAKYGRFTVSTTPDGQHVIYGGVFKPPLSMPHRSKFQHVIFINYVTKELTYYRKIEEWGFYEPVVGYAVVTPPPAELPREVVRGRVTRIDLAPTWCPTANIRREYPDLPKGCLPFGHPKNAMGAVKFEITWPYKNWQLNRIHGAEGYPRGSFWAEKTFGCTRLQNDAIKDLVSEMGGPAAVKEGVEVIAFR